MKPSTNPPPQSYLRLSLYLFALPFICYKDNNVDISPTPPTEAGMVKRVFRDMLAIRTKQSTTLRGRHEYRQ